MRCEYSVKKQLQILSGELKNNTDKVCVCGTGSSSSYIELDFKKYYVSNILELEHFESCILQEDNFREKMVQVFFFFYIYIYILLLVNFKNAKTFYISTAGMCV